MLVAAVLEGKSIREEWTTRQAPDDWRQGTAQRIAPLGSIEGDCFVQPTEQLLDPLKITCMDDLDRQPVLIELCLQLWRELRVPQRLGLDLRRLKPFEVVRKRKL